MYFMLPNGKKVYLHSMKNDYGAFEKTNPVRIELRTNRTCWIVAGLNVNDMDDFLGELFLDQFSQVSNMGKGTKTRIKSSLNFPLRCNRAPKKTKFMKMSKKQLTFPLVEGL